MPVSASIDIYHDFFCSSLADRLCTNSIEYNGKRSDSQALMGQIHPGKSTKEDFKQNPMAGIYSPLVDDLPHYEPLIPLPAAAKTRRGRWPRKLHPPIPLAISPFRIS
ncbi:hypothetical protein QC764_0049250 [Podospora pseudoanserina]|uniref:Uncharacterized protein n=1 Tax=Podospora pseudoanserina TaxID=2609844 RepID=A0ABR0ICL8_9PEZI|nr:hypothetical protein QC764_0049250 [Podospora pseudoanserina]